MKRWWLTTITTTTTIHHWIVMSLIVLKVIVHHFVVIIHHIRENACNIISATRSEWCNGTIPKTRSCHIVATKRTPRCGHQHSASFGLMKRKDQYGWPNVIFYSPADGWSTMIDGSAIISKHNNIMIFPYFWLVVFFTQSKSH